MRHTILVATLSSVFASVLTTAVISGSLLGANTANSANTTGEAIIVQPGGVESILQGDVDCDSVVGTRESQGILRYVLEQPALSQDEPCPDIATLIPAGEGVPGPQGPQGDEGPAGPQGEQGPQGATGLSEYEIVSETSASNSAFSKQVIAECPDGKDVLGGGGGIFGTNGHVAITYSHPGPGNWVTGGHEHTASSSSWYVNAWAICANVAE